MTDTGYRVLVVDDRPIFVKGVRSELEDAGDIDVIGECSNGAEAVALVEQERPDVALIDLRIPPAAGDEAEFCGLDVIRRIAELELDTRILVLSMHEEPEHVRAALKAGANGYLRKEEKGVAQAVRTVAEGKIVLDARAGRALLGQQAQLVDGELAFGLTRAEYRMLVLMVKGTEETADRCGVEPPGQDSSQSGGKYPEGAQGVQLERGRGEGPKNGIGTE
jgi:DNA-binding NarL/FixJ family response regulator